MFQEIASPSSESHPRGLLELTRGLLADHPRDDSSSTADVLEVAQVWGDVILDLRHFAAGSGPITLRSGLGWKRRPFGRPRPVFQAPSEILPGGDLTLFTWADGLVLCTFPEGCSASVHGRDGSLSLKEVVKKGIAKLDEDGLYHMALPPDTRVVLDFGVMQFVARVVPQGHRVLTRLVERLDYPFLAVLSSTLFAGLLSGVLVASQPPPPEDQVIEIPHRIIDMILANQKAEPDRVVERQAESGESPRAKKDEGRTSKREDRSKGRRADVQRQQMDKEIAENAGVLGAMHDGSELDSVFDNSSLSPGISAGVGGLIGVRGVEIGTGLGGRGIGIGGGGPGGIGGIGGMGTHGNRSGDKSYGESGGQLWKKPRGEISLGGGEAIFSAPIDKALVDAVVRRNLALIRHCYQMELTRSPSLSGKITERFVIGRDGSVSAASTKSSSLGNAKVEQCINQRFLRFQFPAPKGNGVVFVTYPFIFSPG